MSKGGVKIELPRKPFLYTLDQVSTLTAIPIEKLKRKMCWFRGRSTFIHETDMLAVHNIAAKDKEPDWRVHEDELVRWLRRKGFTVS